MPTKSFWIDPNNFEIMRCVDSLQPTPGYCIFIDIAGSTEMKQKGIRHWIALTHNCFANTKLFLDPFAPVKSIGDALMYYIELSDLSRSGYKPLQIFDGLWKVATDRHLGFPAVKIGAAKCRQGYALTFLRGNQDYYGIDIDMTARLQNSAGEREIVIERGFYEDITVDYQNIGNQEQFVSYRSLRGPTKEKLKGIPGLIEVFRARAI
jgi:hypothetical protein